MSKILIIGSGYVGLSAASLFIRKHEVICADISEERIATLNKGIVPIWEPGMEEVFSVYKDNLRFVKGISTAIKQCNDFMGLNTIDFIFVTVGTPQSEKDYSTDLTALKSVIEEIGDCYVDGPKADMPVVVSKSTVPVGTCAAMQKLLQGRGVNIKVLSNPEFLAQGTAVNDMFEPTRIVFGGDKEDKVEMDKLEALYKSVNPGSPIVRVTKESSELIKYASNCFLATKISFINEIARFCDAVGADVKDVAEGMGFDPRIGNKFLNAGLGYGGSCFPKDTRSLCYQGKSHNLEMGLLENTIKVNDTQVDYVFRKMMKEFDSLSKSSFVVMGITFKEGTDGMQDSPIVNLVKRLADEGATFTIFEDGIKDFDRTEESIIKAGIDKSCFTLETTLVDILGAVKNAEAVIMGHAFKTVTVETLLDIASKTKRSMLLDYVNCLNRDLLDDAISKGENKVSVKFTGR